MKRTVAKSLNAALHQLFEDSDDVLLIGEDLADPYGGAFKISKGLSTAFPKRVLSTPISEGALGGLAAGMAMRGLRPIVEIMFGDFLTLCTDQLVNHIAKYRWMYNDKVTLPIVFRAPMGGRRGYGPTHSQTLEKLFCGIPGLRIVAPNRLTDPGELLAACVATDEPVIFVENKLMYPQTVYEADSEMIEGAQLRRTRSSFPTTTLSWSEFETVDVTLVAYGGMADLAIQAGRELMLEDEIACEVVVLTHIKPFDQRPIADSVQRSKALLVVEEGSEGWGWGREVVYRLSQSCPESAARGRSIGARELPLGNASSLEETILPQVADIKNAVRRLVQPPSVGA